MNKLPLTQEDELLYKEMHMRIPRPETWLRAIQQSPLTLRLDPMKRYEEGSIPAALEAAYLEPRSTADAEIKAEAEAVLTAKAEAEGQPDVSTHEGQVQALLSTMHGFRIMRDYVIPSAWDDIRETTRRLRDESCSLWLQASRFIDEIKAFQGRLSDFDFTAREVLRVALEFAQQWHTTAKRAEVEASQTKVAKDLHEAWERILASKALRTMAEHAMWSAKYAEKVAEESVFNAELAASDIQEEDIFPEAAGEVNVDYEAALSAYVDDREGGDAQS